MTQYDMDAVPDKGLAAGRWPSIKAGRACGTASVFGNACRRAKERPPLQDGGGQAFDITCLPGGLGKELDGIIWDRGIEPRSMARMKSSPPIWAVGLRYGDGWDMPMQIDPPFLASLLCSRICTRQYPEKSHPEGPYERGLRVMSPGAAIDEGVLPKDAFTRKGIKQEDCIAIITQAWAPSSPQ